jgi:hypothetical protein
MRARWAVGLGIVALVAAWVVPRIWGIVVYKWDSWHCQRASFANGKVQFADFSLEYLGKTEQPFQRGSVQHFRVTTPAGQSKVIKWSAGTGDIGETHFDLGSRQYSLELMESERVEGPLAADELLICPNSTPYRSPQVQ